MSQELRDNVADLASAGKELRRSNGGRAAASGPPSPSRMAPCRPVSGRAYSAERSLPSSGLPMIPRHKPPGYPDVGCGEGQLGAALKQLDPSRSVYGVEIDTEAAVQAARRLDE